MYLQPWVIVYFVAAIFCFLTANSFVKSKNTSRLLLGYLVLASGCWALLDGLTQISSPEIGLIIQNTVILLSVFVAFFFLLLAYSFIVSLKRKTLPLLMLVPLFTGLTFSLFGEVYLNAERVYIHGFSYIHLVYNDVSFIFTVSILFILIIAGFLLMAKAIKTTKDEDLRKNITLFTIGVLIAITSSYILGTGEIVYYLPPLSSVAISIGIAVSSLSFKTKHVLAS